MHSTMALRRSYCKSFSFVFNPFVSSSRSSRSFFKLLLALFWSLQLLQYFGFWKRFWVCEMNSLYQLGYDTHSPNFHFYFKHQLNITFILKCKKNL
ncbi:hypothetical protein VIGAN_07227700 [Vigna angularis var. angularis]|uniref:Uncharacterized protein n=1 Tax=Vigna angularis var. angularis TaxID=157739 RepID=A0A0S3SKH4_PHAAN|nr:hypothetical protein VIGAN_07227700 [Vigna angularis var. angularis]